MISHHILSGFSCSFPAGGLLVWKKKKGRTPKSPARNKKYSHVYLQINTHNCISLILINLQTLLTRQAVLLKYLLPYCSLTNQLCYNLFRSIKYFTLYLTALTQPHSISLSKASSHLADSLFELSAINCLPDVKI